MPTLLLITHCPSPNTERLRDAVIEGVRHPDIEGVELVVKAPLEADHTDVLAADGIILGTTENFGSMAGRLKDFFERVYYPCLEQTQGKPYALYVRAGNDGRGTIDSVERIVTDLRWKEVIPPVRRAGDFDPGFVDQCRELGMTLAAGLEAGIY